MESLRVKGDTEVPYLSTGWTVEPFTEMESTEIEPGRQGTWGGGRVCKTVTSSLQCCLGPACMCPAVPLHTRKKLLLNFVPLVPLGTSSQTPQLTSPNYYMDMYIICMHLSLTALGLCYWAQAFLSCSEWGATLSPWLWYLTVGLSLQWPLPLQSTGSREFGLQQLLHVGSAVAARGLQSMRSVVDCTGLGTLQHVRSSWTRDRTSVPLHCKADSPPPDRQRSPKSLYFLYSSV